MSDAWNCCPCNPDNTELPSLVILSYIGNNYFCESAAVSESDWNNALWDGNGCVSGNGCCRFNNPLWFNKTLPALIADNKLCLHNPMHADALNCVSKNKK